MDSLPLWLLVTIFVAAGVVVWFAGIRLRSAITVSAAASGDVSVAVGNIPGGIVL